MQQIIEREQQKRQRQRLLSLQELNTEKGIPYSRPHLHRLVVAGQFPRPIKLGLNRNAWIEEEIDAWIDGRIAARDTAKVGA